MSGCHGDLDIMQDNKLSASNMWKEESDADDGHLRACTSTCASALKSVTRHLPLLG